jgi:hypothetical protein
VALGPYSWQHLAGLAMQLRLRGAVRSWPQAIAALAHLRPKARVRMSGQQRLAHVERQRQAEALAGGITRLATQPSALGFGGGGRLSACVRPPGQAPAELRRQRGGNHGVSRQLLRAQLHLRLGPAAWAKRTGPDTGAARHQVAVKLAWPGCFPYRAR